MRSDEGELGLLRMCDGWEVCVWGGGGGYEGDMKREVERTLRRKKM